MTAPSQSGSNRRAAIFGGIGIGLVLLVLIGTRLAGGGGSEAPLPTLPPSGIPTTTTTTTTEPTGDLETFEVFTTKNPFTPLAGGVTGGGGSTSSPTNDPGSAPSPGSGAGSGSTATTAPRTGSSGAAEPTRSQRVTLVEMFTEAGRTTANVKVDDTVYKVSEGEAFATSYRAISLSSAERCGRFVFGDDQFRLCVGEEVLK